MKRASRQLGTDQGFPGPLLSDVLIRTNAIFLAFLEEQVPLFWVILQEPLGNFENRSRIFDKTRTNVYVCSQLTRRCCD